MAGIYLHVPFCKQACHYCNFHFSTSTRYKKDMVLAIAKEIQLRKEELGSDPITSIYFGGGTPSLLNSEEINLLFNELYRCFNIATDAEITLEANPDDLTTESIKVLQSSPVNRLSIGIQSFHDNELEYMNRAHHSGQAHSCVLLAQEHGFENISIDLIYGCPISTSESWMKTLNRATELNVSHISAYCLTVEPKTALAHFIKSGKYPAVDEEQASDQFLQLIEHLDKNGFIHYETSNFCKENAYSKHNTSYWTGAHYLGLGPAAHSFKGKTRSWNIANNSSYIKQINANILPSEQEDLKVHDRYNEYLMTSFRTIWGLSIAYVNEQFGAEYVAHLKKSISHLIDTGTMIQKDANTLALPPKVKFIADGIIADLFLEADLN